jgi:nondiscriminating glutamyl-tRNA synthetase
LRGDEHLPNTPVQLAIQSALGLQSPRYAHLPLILNEHHQKLSKRHDTVSIEEFRDIGIQPEAMIDHLALLGWSSPDGREEFTLEDLASLFSLERVQKAGAIFNEARLLAFNARVLRKMPQERKIALLESAMERWGYPHAQAWIASFLDAYGEELQTIEQARPLVAALHADGVTIPQDERARMSDAPVRDFLSALADRGGDPRLIPTVGAEFGIEKKEAYHLARIALTGSPRGAPLALLVPLLGPERIAARLRAAGNQGAASAR